MSKMHIKRWWKHTRNVDISEAEHVRMWYENTIGANPDNFQSERDFLLRYVCRHESDSFKVKLLKKIHRKNKKKLLDKITKT